MSCAKHSYDFDGSLDLVIAPHVVTPISAPFSTGSAVILAPPNEALQDEKS